MSRRWDQKLAYAQFYSLERKTRGDEPGPTETRAVRAMTTDAAPPALADHPTYPPADAGLRADAIRGVVGLYGRGLVTAGNLLKVIVDIATEPRA